MPNRHNRPNNLIEYRPEWTDKFGLMGNAIEWVTENLSPGQTVQGIRFFNGSIDRFEITRNELGRRRRQSTQIHIRLDQRNPNQRVDIRDHVMQVWSKNNNQSLPDQVYKRFIVNGKSEWHLVSEIKSVNYTPDRCPMFVVEYLANLTRMLNEWWRALHPDHTDLPIDFTNLVLRNQTALKVGTSRLHDLSYYTGEMVTPAQFEVWAQVRKMINETEASHEVVLAKDWLGTVLNYAELLGHTLAGGSHVEREWYNEQHWLVCILGEIKTNDDPTSSTLSDEQRQDVGQALYTYLQTRVTAQPELATFIRGMIANVGMDDIVAKYSTP